MAAGILYSLLLDRCDNTGDRHHDRGLEIAAQETRVDTADEFFQHDLGDLEIGNDPFAQRPDCFDNIGRAAQHEAGALADRKDSACSRVNRHYGRFAENNTPPLYINKNGCRPQVNANIQSKTHV